MKKDLLQRVRWDGNPLIDGETVTFIWQGESAPHLIDDLHGWENNPQRLERVGAGTWALSFQLARDSYLEYSFYDPRSKKRFRDPFNKNRIYNGVGSYNNFFYMPETFGKIISQSGVFNFEGLDCSVVDLIRHAPRPDVKIWMDVGKLEWLLEDNRRMQPILKESEYDVIYRETGGAHNYTTWRNRLGYALITMFGKSD